MITFSLSHPQNVVKSIDNQQVFDRYHNDGYIVIFLTNNITPSLMMAGAVLIYNTIDVQYRINQTPTPKLLLWLLVCLSLLNFIFINVCTALAVIELRQRWYAMLLIYMVCSFMILLIIADVSVWQVRKLILKFQDRTGSSNVRNKAKATEKALYPLYAFVSFLNCLLVVVMTALIYQAIHISNSGNSDEPPDRANPLDWSIDIFAWVHVVAIFVFLWWSWVPLTVLKPILKKLGLETNETNVVGATTLGETPTTHIRTVGVVHNGENQIMRTPPPATGTMTTPRLGGAHGGTLLAGTRAGMIVTKESSQQGGAGSKRSSRGSSGRFFQPPGLHSAPASARNTYNGGANGAGGAAANDSAGQPATLIRPPTLLSHNASTTVGSTGGTLTDAHLDTPGGLRSTGAAGGVSGGSTLVQPGSARFQGRTADDVAEISVSREDGERELIDGGGVTQHQQQQQPQHHQHQRRMSIGRSSIDRSMIVASSGATSPQLGSAALSPSPVIAGSGASGGPPTLQSGISISTSVRGVNSRSRNTHINTGGGGGGGVTPIRIHTPQLRPTDVGHHQRTSSHTVTNDTFVLITTEPPTLNTPTTNQ